MKHIDRASRPPGSSARLHRVDFEILRNLIHDKSGIYFQDNKLHVLQSRIISRLEALCVDYYEDYVDYVLDPVNYAEILRMVDAVTSLETSFFRSPAQFDCLENQILPSLIKQKVDAGEKTLRIWSAACATGEEVYSLAMIADACSVPGQELLNIEIIGSDINTGALQTAERGFYRTKTAEQLPVAYLESCFSPRESGYQLHQALIDAVTFKRINLADRTDMMRMHSIDLVPCANVLHSFLDETKQRTLQAIYNNMNDEGYFLTGASETLFGLSHPFLEINIEGTRVFQKCV